jgi:hypothetical protein
MTSHTGIKCMFRRTTLTFAYLPRLASGCPSPPRPFIATGRDQTSHFRRTPTAPFVFTLRRDISSGCIMSRRLHSTERSQSQKPHSSVEPASAAPKRNGHDPHNTDQHHSHSLFHSHSHEDENSHGVEKAMYVLKGAGMFLLFQAHYA